MAGVSLTALTACGGGRAARSTLPSSVAASCAPLPSIAPQAVGIATSTIDSLQRLAVAMKSDAILVLRDGKVVHEWSAPGFRMPFNPQSITKAITGLGVGVLLDRGTIRSLDVPLSEFFPEFRAPDKAPVTLRMLMNHTSGVAAERGEGQFYRSGAADVGQYVRSRPMQEPAGTRFRYSNVGAQLVSHVVQAAAGAPLHALLDSTVFAPLCIRDWRWDVDARGATYGYSRVQLTARDLAAIGHLVLERGLWRGTQVLRAETIDSLTHLRGGPVRGLAAESYVGLWMYYGQDSVRVDTALVSRLRTIGVSDSLRQVVQGALGEATARRISTGAFISRLDSTFGNGQGVARWYRETKGQTFPDRWRTPALAVGHSGSWGQRILVLPESRTVVVRFARPDNPARRDEDDEFAWPSFARDMYRLLGTTSAGQRERDNVSGVTSGRVGPSSR